ncbi:hypothetical protein VLK31_34960 [Variovorax sp. H27-G14]|uniref:hypothetical protein n=1 Tax=Variovorax sp. H27-G14 TaxID=3111914 RepID=UPI0038FCD965
MSGSGDKNGGAGSQQSSQSKEPWAAAAPWMMNNIKSGQALQAQYEAQPFNAQQLAAYQNLGQQNNYTNALIPSLLGQLSSNPSLGYDRNNPTARPKAFDFDGGLLQMLSNPAKQTPTANPERVAAPVESGNFMQQGDVLNGANMSSFDGQTMLGSGGYGSFKYGMQPPKPGTKEYRDMSEYFANGGSDPNDIYGRQASAYQMPPSNPLSRLWTSGGMGANGGGGIGDTGANAAASASGNGAW